MSGTNPKKLPTQVHTPHATDITSKPRPKKHPIFFYAYPSRPVPPFARGIFHFIFTAIRPTKPQIHATFAASKSIYGRIRRNSQKSRPHRR